MDEDSDDEVYVHTSKHNSSPRKLSWSLGVEDMIPDDEQDTDIDFDEIITPDTSLTISPRKPHWIRHSKEKKSSLPSEQMEAAMTLLVFKDS